MAKTTRASSHSSGKVPADLNKSVDSDENLTLIRRDISGLRNILEKTVKKDDLEQIVTAIVGKLLEKNKEEHEKLISEIVDKKCDVLQKQHKKEMNKLHDKIERAEKEIESLREQIVESKKDIREMQQQCKENERRVNFAYRKANYNEQYSRKTNFKIFGVTEKQEEVTMDVMCKVLQKTAGITVDRDDVLACHRIPGASDKERPILVKMKNSECKSKVMKLRSKVKNSGKGVRLVDDVTRANAELITRLTNHSDIQSAWYFNGAVYAEHRGKRIKFDITDDDEAAISQRLGGR